MHSLPTPLVQVEAPARLHLGFLDLHGGLGRRFGSLGLTIDAFATRLEASPAADFAAAGPGAERALAWARGYAAARDLRGGAHLRITQTIPAHAGFGSGTQLALAVGTALERLLGPAPDGSRADCRTVAQLLGRGRRSGIGIGAFAHGGFICDGGGADPATPPPVVMHLPFPAAWRVLLLLDPGHQGLCGEPERRAFAALPQFPAETAGHLCRLVLMQLAPALAEAQFAPAAGAFGEIQRAIGSHFAPAQGGVIASPAVADALAWAGAQGYTGLGQSSWGPTGFILVPDAAEADRLLGALKARGGADDPLAWRIAAGRNTGARVSGPDRPPTAGGAAVPPPGPGPEPAPLSARDHAD